MKIFVIGDSISIHYGPWLEKFLTDMGFEYSRKGMDVREVTPPNLDDISACNGGDSANVLSYLQNRIATAPIEADAVLVNCGLHDVKTNIASGKKQIDIESYRKNLEAIVTLVTEKIGKMIWIRTTPCDEAIHNKPGMTFHRFSKDVTAYNSVADICMAARSIPTIDLHTITKNQGTATDIFFDHVHFRENVRRIQATYIAGWLDAWRKLI